MENLQAEKLIAFLDEAKKLEEAARALAAVSENHISMVDFDLTTGGLSRVLLKLETVRVPGVVAKEMVNGSIMVEGVFHGVLLRDYVNPRDPLFDEYKAELPGGAQ